MLFDCLTYRPKDVPRLSHYVDFNTLDLSDLSLRGIKHLDYMCFDYTHLRKWLDLLHHRLIRKGYDIKGKLRHFYSTEYGTDERYTHRPHIHVLFYVYGSCVPPDVLSREISSCWPYGRTDGIRYRGARYFYDECVIKSSLASSTRVCKYVSKYVQKDCKFQKELDKRIWSVMWRKYRMVVRYSSYLDFSSGLSDSLSLKELRDDDAFMEFVNSPLGRETLRTLKRTVNQFHRQSHGYGLSAIADIDLDELVKTNTLVCPDADKIVMRIPLPTYYKRKLFYEVTEYDSQRMWQLTQRGVRYMRKREKYLREYLVRVYDSVKLNAGFSYDSVGLVHYMLDKRGRLSGLPYEPTIDEKKNLPDLLFNYSTPSDVRKYKGRYVMREFIPLDSCEHLFSPHLFLPVGLFIKDNVYLDAMYEAVIDKISSYTMKFGAKKQECYELRQHLKHLYQVFLDV